MNTYFGQITRTS